MARGAEQSGAKRTRPRTPAQLERQSKVFELHIQRKTVRQIAAEIGITQETVIKDIRCESLARAAMNAEVREEQQAVQLAMLDALYADAMKRFDLQGTSALPTAAKALEMRAKLLGLDAPIKVDTGVAVLLNALNGTKEKGTS